MFARVYRYGYQGSEKDDEVSGGGNSYTTHFRQLDVRLGRWWAIDPVTQPSFSLYVSMNDNPIWHNDVFGDKVDYGGDTKKEQRQNKRKAFFGRVFSKGARQQFRADKKKETTVTYSFNEGATNLQEGGDRSAEYNQNSRGEDFVGAEYVNFSVTYKKSWGRINLDITETSGVIAQSSRTRSSIDMNIGLSAGDEIRLSTQGDADDMVMSRGGTVTHQSDPVRGPHNPSPGDRIFNVNRDISTGGQFQSYTITVDGTYRIQINSSTDSNKPRNYDTYFRMVRITTTQDVRRDVYRTVRVLWKPKKNNRIKLRTRTTIDGEQSKWVKSTL